MTTKTEKRTVLSYYRKLLRIGVQRKQAFQTIKLKHGISRRTVYYWLRIAQDSICGQ